MIIVAGYLILKPQTRQSFLNQSNKAVQQARQAAGCVDFSVSPDLIGPNRVNIFEKWERRDALERFRQEGPSGNFSEMIASYHVGKFEV